MCADLNSPTVGNPVTARLAAGIEDDELLGFIRLWDQLERLVVEVYRGGRATRSQRAFYKSLRKQLSRAYPRWEPDLAGYRLELQAAGSITHGDPFGRILAVRHADEFFQTRTPIELLPDARQTLNHFLLDLIDPGSLAADG
jgi:hypothetical protein